MSDTPALHRPKLGLALAGGGFRASLFHLGVLRRLAELDLLRYVEVLSTVSGGSIIGTLYVLHLKNALTEKPLLASSEYVEIMEGSAEKPAYPTFHESIWIITSHAYQ